MLTAGGREAVSKKVTAIIQHVLFRGQQATLSNISVLHPTEKSHLNVTEQSCNTSSKDFCSL